MKVATTSSMRIREIQLSVDDSPYTGLWGEKLHCKTLSKDWSLEFEFHMLSRTRL